MLQQTVDMDELKTIYKEFGPRVQISTPDGWVPIINWFDMGEKQLVTIKTQLHSLECAVSHLIETLRDGAFIWLLSDELEVGDEILTDAGIETIQEKVYGLPEECHDIEVAHPNHRYWAAGVSSHNCGKSYGVEQIVEKANLFDRLADRPCRSTIIKGSTTAIGLYMTLYKFSDPKSVVIFDDCDVFSDLKILDLLKGALDTGKTRKISWLGESFALHREGVPDSFNFQGSVIFLTNISFGNSRSKTLKVHLEALESRCHVVDLKIESARDKVLRIKQVVQDGMLDEYDLSDIAKDEILAFVTDNQANMRELSLRAIVKVAQLYAAFPDNWLKFAKTSMLKSV